MREVSPEEAAYHALHASGYDVVVARQRLKEKRKSLEQGKLSEKSIQLRKPTDKSSDPA